jgi:hypothetical protein
VPQATAEMVDGSVTILLGDTRITFSTEEVSGSIALDGTVRPLAREVTPTP